jgi:hypothetical protein
MYREPITSYAILVPGTPALPEDFLKLLDDEEDKQ